MSTTSDSLIGLGATEPWSFCLSIDSGSEYHCVLSLNDLS